MPMAAASATFHNILGVLTDHTWGIGVTLNDFQPLAFGAGAAAQAAKGGKKPAAGAGGGGKGGNEDFSGGVRHPMHCLTFLKGLRGRLDVNEALAAAAAAAAGKKGGAAPRGGKVGGDTVVIAGPRSGGLKALSVLALTHAHLSRPSIDALKRVLQLAAPTLTDLDLSFAYTGYHGAEALAAVLARSDCQLTRLGLAGNALGDQALEVRV